MFTGGKKKCETIYWKIILHIWEYDLKLPTLRYMVVKWLNVYRKKGGIDGVKEEEMKEEGRKKENPLDN